MIALSKVRDGHVAGALLAEFGFYANLVIGSGGSRGYPVIVYSLACTKGHGFEGWFKDSAAYDEQAAAGKLVCPVCQSRKIDKAPMAPAVAGTRSADRLPTAQIRKVRELMMGVRKYVEDNAENVGSDFPDEARKIHYGETDERPIYGEATLDEAQDLIEEGIDVAPMPPEMDEAN